MGFLFFPSLPLTTFSGNTDTLTPEIDPGLEVHYLSTTLLLSPFFQDVHGGPQAFGRSDLPRPRAK